MKSRHGELSRCMASTYIKLHQSIRAYEPLHFNKTWHPSLANVRLQVASFSSSQSHATRKKWTSRQRRPNGAATYPVFRNETQHHRMIRENQLFNPFDRGHKSEDQRRAVLASSHSGTLPLELVSSSGLEDEMVYLASHTDSHKSKPLKILAALLKQRNRELQSVHFETLIALNASPRHGTALGIRLLLEEMETLKIARDINIHTAVLRSLVVHPDVDLLNQTLEACAAMWYDLDTEMLHYVTAIYVRLGMPELALDYLDCIERGSGSNAPSSQRRQAALWIYVLFIRHLAEKKDWDGVLRICYRLHDDPSIGPFSMRQLDIPHAFWLELLRKCVADRDLWVTLWIWRIWVLRAWIVPPITICAGALRIFTEHARYDDMYGTLQIIKAIRQSSDKSVNFRSIELAVRLELVDEAVREAENMLESIVPPKDAMHNAAHWTSFRHDSLSRSFAPDGLKIDPWSVLAKDDADPGKLWLRVRSESNEMEKQPEMTRQFQVMAKEKAERDAAVVSGWPEELRDDIDRVARLDFDLRRLKFRPPALGHLRRAEYEENVEDECCDDEDTSDRLRDYSDLIKE